MIRNYKTFVLYLSIIIFTHITIAQKIMDVHTAIRTRRSIRKFQPKPIPVEILKNIVQDGTLAPSAGNKQPWEFIIVTEEQQKNVVFENIYWLASAGKPDILHQPQAYIIVLGNPQISKEYIYDCSAAIENMLLSAWGYGIGSCWIGSINREKIYTNFNIPQTLKIVAIIALGYPDETPEILITEKNFSPYKKNNKLIVPKRKLDTVVHFNKYTKK